MAVVVGMGNGIGPVHDEFDVTDMERGRVDELINSLCEALGHSREQRNVVLAALAELSARYLQEEPPSAASATTRRKRTAS